MHRPEPSDRPYLPELPLEHPRTIVGGVSPAGQADSVQGAAVPWVEAGGVRALRTAGGATQVVEEIEVHRLEQLESGADDRREGHGNNLVSGNGELDLQQV